MKKSRLLGAVCACILTLTLSSARASVIYSFDVSDVTWATTVVGDFSNTTFWFEFADSADLNALISSDLLSMGFDTALDHEALSSNSLGRKNIDRLFGISGSVASLTVGGAGSASVWCGQDCNGINMQVGRDYIISLVFGAVGEFNTAYNPEVSHTYYSSTSAVPIPAAIWLFGFGLLGLVGLARRKAGRK